MDHTAWCVNYFSLQSKAFTSHTLTFQVPQWNLKVHYSDRISSEVDEILTKARCFFHQIDMGELITFPVVIFDRFSHRRNQRDRYCRGTEPIHTRTSCLFSLLISCFRVAMIFGNCTSAKCYTFSLPSILAKLYSSFYCSKFTLFSIKLDITVTQDHRSKGFTIYGLVNFPRTIISFSSHFYFIYSYFYL